MWEENHLTAYLPGGVYVGWIIEISSVSVDDRPSSSPH